MGIDHNAYIGPYLTAKIAMVSKTIDNCVDHGFVDTMNFCPKCGKNKHHRITTHILIDAPDAWAEEYPKGLIYDYLICTSVMSDPPTIDGFKTYVFYPNRYWKELNIPEIKGGETTLDFSQINITEMTDKFKTLFAEEIAYMRQWFEVEIHFGYISYYS